MSSFESAGFVLEDGIAKVDGESQSGTELPSTKVISGMGTSPVDVPKSSFLSIPPSTLKFSPGPSSDREGLFAFKVLEGSDGDKRPSIRNGKAFRFVPHPSSDHLKKMEEHRKLNCTILKYVKVPSPGYGAVLTVITPGSLDKKELYEVSISNFPACTCKSFKFMCTRALGNEKHKWMPCKHLYFLLQEHFSCTEEDVFIHCPGWTPNEVKLLLHRATWLK